MSYGTRATRFTIHCHLGIIRQDTELMLATCRAIVKREIFDVKTVVEELAQTYSKGRPRAYPETMTVILPRLAEGLV